MSDTGTTRDWPTLLERGAKWALGACIFTGWALLSFDGIAELGREVVGWDTQKALLLPLTVDALVAVTFIMAARAKEPDPVLLTVAAGAAAVSLCGNGVAWLYDAGMAVPGPAAVFVVSALAPACGFVFLHLIMRRDTTCDTQSQTTTGTSQRNGTTPAQTEAASSSGPAPTTSPKPRTRTRRGTGAATGPRSGDTASPGTTTTSTGTAPAASTARPTDEQRIAVLAKHPDLSRLSQDRAIAYLQQTLGEGGGVSKSRAGRLLEAASNGHRS